MIGWNCSASICISRITASDNALVLEAGYRKPLRRLEGIDDQILRRFDSRIVHWDLRHFVRGHNSRQYPDP